MRPLLLGLTLAALLCLAAAAALLQSGIYVASDTPLLVQTLAQMTVESGRYVSFAAGIVALVTMGQRHQWRWFVAMLVLVLLLTYGPDVLPALPWPSMDDSDSPYKFALAVLAQRYVTYPAFVPLALLFYRPSMQRNEAEDRPADSGLEVGPLISHEATSGEG